MPPSSAVYGENKGGYYHAVKGRTILPFSFDLPKDSPSSYTFQAVARLLYTVTGVVQMQYRDKQDTIFKSKIATIASSISGNTSSEPLASIYCKQMSSWGDNGFIELNAQVPTSSVPSGSNLLVLVHVDNASTKKVIC